MVLKKFSCNYSRRCVEGINRESWGDMDVSVSLEIGLGRTHGILEKSARLKREACIRFLWEIYLKIVKGRGTYKEDWNSMIREVQRKISIIKFNVVQLLSCVWLFATPWTAVHQASLSFMYPPKFTQAHVQCVDEV